MPHQPDRSLEKPPRPTTYRDLRTAIHAAGGTFGALFTLVEATGMSGGKFVILWLGLASLAVGTVVFLKTRYRLRQLRREAPGPVPSEDVERLALEVEQVMGPQSASVFSAIVASFRQQIACLNDELRAQRSRLAMPVAIPATGSLVLASSVVERADYPGKFLIDSQLVTNRAFQEFLSENPDWLPEAATERYEVPYFLCEFNGHEPMQDKWDHPVVWVSWFAAAAFCNWRSRRHDPPLRQVYSFRSPTDVDADLFANGWRLPTVAEWRLAVGSEGISGLRLDPMRLNYGMHYRGTTSVGRFPPLIQGRPPLFDILGNVKQWCHDDDPANPKNRLFTGLSWMDRAPILDDLQASSIPAQNTNPDFGFRCARIPRDCQPGPPVNAKAVN